MSAWIPYSPNAWAGDMAAEGHLTVLSLVPGAPAANSGLRVGDRIVEVNGDLLPSGGEGLHLFSHWLRESHEGTLRLGVQRRGFRESVTVRPVPACSYIVMLSEQGEENAFTGQQSVLVTTGMLRLLDKDDDVAVVIAHEVAHILAGHTEHAPVAGMRDDVEPEADYLGIYIAARAGFDVFGAADLLRRITQRTHEKSHANPTHQGAGSASVIARRLRAIETAVIEIQAKRTARENLQPSPERLLTHDWVPN